MAVPLMGRSLGEGFQGRCPLVSPSWTLQMFPPCLPESPESFPKSSVPLILNASPSSHTGTATCPLLLKGYPLTHPIPRWHESWPMAKMVQVQPYPRRSKGLVLGIPLVQGSGGSSGVRAPPSMVSPRTWALSKASHRAVS